MGTVSKVTMTNGSGGAVPADTFGSWTVLDAIAVSTTATLLDFSDGTDTGWDITVTDAPSETTSGGVNSVGSGDADWVDEAVVSTFYHAATSSNPAEYEFSGLDNSKTYTIKVFGSRANTAPRQAEFSVDGHSTNETIEASFNSTDIALFENVSPSSGIIDLSMRVVTGTFGYINAVQIEEFDAAEGTILPFIQAYYRGLN